MWFEKDILKWKNEFKRLEEIQASIINDIMIWNFQSVKKQVENALHQEDFSDYGKIELYRLLVSNSWIQWDIKEVYHYVNQIRKILKQKNYNKSKVIFLNEDLEYTEEDLKTLTLNKIQNDTKRINEVQNLESIISSLFLKFNNNNLNTKINFEKIILLETEKLLNIWEKARAFYYRFLLYNRLKNKEKEYYFLEESAKLWEQEAIKFLKEYKLEKYEKEYENSKKIWDYQSAFEILNKITKLYQNTEIEIEFLEEIILEYSFEKHSSNNNINLIFLEATWKIEKETLIKLKSDIYLTIEKVIDTLITKDTKHILTQAMFFEKQWNIFSALNSYIQNFQLHRDKNSLDALLMFLETTLKEKKLDTEIWKKIITELTLLKQTNFEEFQELIETDINELKEIIESSLNHLKK